MKEISSILKKAIIIELFFIINNAYACYEPVPPTAILTGSPTTVFIQQDIYLDGSQSIAGSGSIMNWLWNFDYDNNPTQWFVGESTATRKYETTGTYKIALMVQNTYGLWSTVGEICEVIVTVKGVIYVKNNATGNNNGFTWQDAFNDLQNALNVANSGAQIWVAKGNKSYKPTNIPTERNASFVLKSGVSLYGGFVGNETVLVARDWKNNSTILSGDIGTLGIDTDNCYNVVTGVTGSTVDGFTITKGYADHASITQYQSGGGMFNSNCSPTILNCTFTYNYAYYGGGMSNNNSSSPILTDCSFIGNNAYYRGGGIENYITSSPTITRCIFAENSATSADYGGGAMFCYSSSHPNLKNCLFRDNVATNGYGGAIYFHTTAQTINVENCTFSQNVADNGYGGAIYSYYSGPYVVDSILWGNSDLLNDCDVVINGQTFDISYSDYSDISWMNAAFNSSACIQIDPLFADPSNNDFHLKSKDGRWNGSTWVTTDTVYSKCLVHGHPGLSYSNEPSPNGSKRNMGAYGNTLEASKVDNSQLGSLRVQVFVSGNPPTAGPYNAQWRIIYEQEGTWHNPYNTAGFTMGGLVPATGYYVVFKDVDGYTKPANYGPFSISAGNTSIIGGYYIQQ